MKKFLLSLIIILMITGCATRRNIAQAISNREDLVGLTRHEIAQRFGNPHRISTSYSDKQDKIDLWTYYHRSINLFSNPTGTLYITFTNGVASNVSYW